MIGGKYQIFETQKDIIISDLNRIIQTNNGIVPINTEPDRLLIISAE